MKKKALAIIDIQNEYFTPGRPFFLEYGSHTLKNAKAILEFARIEQWPIIHVKHLQEGAIFNPNDPHSEILEDFKPNANESIAIKGDYSSYSSITFKDWMNAHKDFEILVIGYGSTMCCLSTIIDGYHRGHQFTYVHDASWAKRAGALSEASLHEHATEIIKIYAQITDTKQATFSSK